MALAFASDVSPAASPFPSAKGVPERFAGVTVAEKFAFERMAAATFWNLPVMLQGCLDDDPTLAEQRNLRFAHCS